MQLDIYCLVWTDEVKPVVCTLAIEDEVECLAQTVDLPKLKEEAQLLTILQHSLAEPSVFFLLEHLDTAETGKEIGAHLPFAPTLCEQEEHIAQLLLCEITPGVRSVELQAAVSQQRRRLCHQLCFHTLACDLPCRRLSLYIWRSHRDDLL